MRISIADNDIPTFLTDGSYQAVQILLAILVGSPRHAGTILANVQRAAAAETLTDVLRSTHLRNSGEPRAADPIQRLSDNINNIYETSATQQLTIAQYQRWVPQVARYSFYTRDLVTQSSLEPADTSSSAPPPS